MTYIWIVPGLLIVYYTGSYGVFLWKKKQRKASVGVWLHILVSILAASYIILR